VVFSYNGDHMHFGYGEPDRPMEQAVAFAMESQLAYGWRGGVSCSMS
jgi:hypothetical protein